MKRESGYVDDAEAERLAGRLFDAAWTHREQGRHEKACNAFTVAAQRRRARGRMYALGADPGSKSGAVVELLCEGGKPVVVTWVGWKVCSRNKKPAYEVYGDEYEPEVVAPSFLYSEVCARIVDREKSVAVEGLFPGQKKGLLKLAEHAGMLMQALYGAGAVEIQRPLANDWRKRRLRIGSTWTADAAERHAMKMAREEFEWLEGCPLGEWESYYVGERPAVLKWRHREGMLPTVVAGAVAEAAYIALDGAKGGKV